MKKLARQLQPSPDSDALIMPEVRLVLALLIQGLRAALNNDPGARVWLASHDFDYWCEQIDVNPAVLRARVAEVRR